MVDEAHQARQHTATPGAPVELELDRDPSFVTRGPMEKQALNRVDVGAMIALDDVDWAVRAPGASSRC
jgi:hypothetical protein